MLTCIFVKSRVVYVEDAKQLNPFTCVCVLCSTLAAGDQPKPKLSVYIVTKPGMLDSDFRVNLPDTLANESKNYTFCALFLQTFA
jgi:hypothetical protein